MPLQEPSQVDEMFSILQDPCRRHVLYYLTRESDVAGVDTLATAIAASDGTPAEPARPSDGAQVEAMLRHSHLPKLAEAGLVTYDREAGKVRLDDADRAERFLGVAAPVDGYVRAAGDD